MCEETSVAILFADVVGSTSVYERLGDVRAHSLIADCLKIISEAVLRENGRIVKTIGDEVMSTFETAQQATAAAVAIQRSMEQARHPSVSGAKIAVGLHFGPVIEEHGDVFGDAVNLAARMVGLAKAAEILTTLPTVEVMTPEQRVATRQIDRRQVRGKQEEIDIFEVIWQSAGLTSVVLVPELEAARSGSCLTLSFGDLRLELGMGRSAATIGRDPSNDLVIGDPRASRFHARIEQRQGKFVLADESTNGTIVCLEDGNLTLLRREEFILLGSGRIDIGSDVGPPIYFSVERHSDGPEA